MVRRGLAAWADGLPELSFNPIARFAAIRLRTLFVAPQSHRRALRRLCDTPAGAEAHRQFRHHRADRLALRFVHRGARSGNLKG